MAAEKSEWRRILRDDGYRGDSTEDPYVSEHEFMCICTQFVSR